MRNRSFLSLAVTLAIAGAALAVKPGTWTHQSEADFSAGKLEHAVVSNLGDVQLAHGADPLAELAGDDSIVYDLARTDGGAVYLAVGPMGKLARLDGKNVETVAEFEGAQVFALAADKKGLWVGVSGSPSRLELRTGKEMKVERTVELKDVRYIWAIIVDGDQLALATGTPGKVLTINTKAKDPTPVVALEVKQSNVLCLGIDKQSRLYAGTDGDGLVYRLTAAGKTYKPFVLYDAPEPEIGSILVLDDGTVYVGTADAEQAKPGRLAEAKAESTGRPERPDTPEQDPKLPNVPPKPEPKKPGAKGDAKPAAKAPAKPADKAVEKPTEKPADKAPDVAAAPTPAQYDQLRDAIRQKLEQAKQSGTITLQQQPGRPGSSAGRSTLQLRNRTSTSGSATSGKSKSTKQGNAIYRIDSQGYVREVFRESAMILRMVRQDNALIVGTGNDGEIYRVDPDAEEVTLLADIEPQQVPALLSDKNGDVFVGTANPGRVLKLGDKFAKSGTFTSQSLDASQISQWGKLTAMGDTPDGSSVEVQTRSGNVSDVESGSWSEWSKAAKLTFKGGKSGFVTVDSPTARYFQYRLTLKSDGKATPTVDIVTMKYLMPNLKPRVASVKAEYAAKSRVGGDGGEAKPQSTVKIDWEADDANGDKLRYTVEVRPYKSDQPFVKIADDLDNNSYDWDTRTIPDGRYTVRVTASDALDNIAAQAMKATRISDPVTVDNTPPAIKEPTADQTSPGTITVKTLVTDNLTAITDFRYAVDSAKEWKMVLPEDSIFDSTNESILFKIPDLSTGAHVLTLRATDGQGNSRYVSKPFSIK